MNENIFKQNQFSKNSFLYFVVIKCINEYPQKVEIYTKYFILTFLEVINFFINIISLPFCIFNQIPFKTIIQVINNNKPIFIN